MSAKILITGSSGYIGSHLVKFLKKNGAEVFGIDLVFPPKTLQKYFSNHIVDDIANEAAVSHFLEKHQPELVIHCAAKCLVAESVEKPQLYQEYNVTKPTSFLHQCLSHGVKGFLFSSTAATYGEPTQTPIPESHTQLPINPYGATKLEFEKKLLAQKNLTVGIVRYFNAAGADPETEIGEHHEPETHIIPNVLAAIAQNRPVPIFGKDYATKDGTCVRDYIHVMDLADAHWRLANQMLKDNRGGIFNLGSASGFSLLEVVQIAEKVTGKKAQISFQARRPGDPSTLVADSSKCRKELGWNPSHSSLENIVQTAYKWYQSIA